MTKAEEKAWDTMFDKPVPYCLLQNHVPQIVVDQDFHQWFDKFKKKQRIKVGLE